MSLPKSPQTDSHETKINRGFSRGFWGTLVFLLIFVGALEIYGALSIHQEIQEVITEENTHTDDHLNDNDTKSTAKKSSSVSWRQKIIEQTFQSATKEYDVLKLELEKDIQASFSLSRQNIDLQLNAWADWYFSIVGEYARLGHLGAQALGQSNLEDYMLEQLSKRVFKPAGIFENLSKLNHKIKSRFNQQHQQVIKHLNKVLKRQKEQGSAEVDAEFIKSKIAHIEQLEHVATLQPVALLARLTALSGMKAGLKFLVSRSAVKVASSTVVKGSTKVVSGGASKVVLGKGGAQAVASTVALTTLKKGGAKLATSGATKAGAKGAAIASGVSATTICSPLGPLAAVCGITAAVGTWFAVDKAIIEVDEIINRQEFIEQNKVEFAKILNQLEVEINHDLNQYHQQIIRTLVDKQVDHLNQKPKDTRLVDQLQDTLKH